MSSELFGDTPPPSSTATAVASLTAAGGSSSSTVSDPLRQASFASADIAADDEEPAAAASARPRRCDYARAAGACLCPAVDPADVCCIDDCGNKSHHRCQLAAERRAHLLDEPDADPNDEGWYDCGGMKYCLDHHPNSDVLLEKARDFEIDVGGEQDAAAAATALAATAGTGTGTKKKQKKAKSKMSAEEKAEEKKKQMEWAKTMTVANVQLNETRLDVVSVGGVPWDDIKGELRMAFMSANKIPLPQPLRLRADQGKAVANHIRGSSLGAAITAPNRKKSSKSKPACVTNDGTFFKVSNVITSEMGKPNYMETKASHDNTDQDTRDPKPVAWDSLLLLYQETGETYTKIAPGSAGALVGHAVNPKICEDADDLTREELQDVVAYMESTYRQIRNAKTTSGQHRGFAHHANGKAFMIYHHSRLVALGDKDLMNCAYCDVDEDIQRSSTTGFKPLGRKGGRGGAGRRSSGGSSELDVPGGSTSKRDAAAAATEFAAMQVEERNSKLLHSHNFDRMMQMRKKLRTVSRKLDDIESPYKRLKRSKKKGEEYDADRYSTLKRVRKDLMGDQAMYDTEYEQLKAAVGYKEPENVDSSSSSGGESSGNGSD